MRRDRVFVRFASPDVMHPGTGHASQHTLVVLLAMRR